MTNTVYIGLGSNKGDKLQYIQNAVKIFRNSNSVIVEKLSSIYKTKPYGLQDQEDFLNAAAKIRTNLSLTDFFNLCNDIEEQLGRIKNIQWGKREIDIDILFYNDLVYSDDQLSIPHKEIELRDFVIVPMVEIEPEIIHPVSGKYLREIDLSKLGYYIINKLELSVV